MLASLLFIFFLVLVTFFYLFVCVDGNKRGILPDLKRVLFERFPEYLKKTGRATCGNWFVDKIEKFANYICYQANPCVQICYLALVIFGFYIYIRDGYTKLPNAYAGSIHKITGTLLVLQCYKSYYDACTTGPGNITKNTHAQALSRFKFDGVVYKAKQECKTCKFEKPARSKHCSLCGCCIEKMDHHCVWINQCVGRHNYKYFIQFLILHALLCTYAFVVGCAILLSEADRLNLYNATFKTETGTAIKPSAWMIIIFFLKTKQAFTCVLMLTLVAGTALYIFIYYHFILIKAGTTTNESMKQGQYVWSIKQVVTFLEEWLQNYAVLKPTQQNLDLYKLTGRETQDDIRSKIQICKKDLKKMEEWCYKPRSLWEGLKEIYFS